LYFDTFAKVSTCSTIHELTREQKATARQFVMPIFYANRPLSITELQHALAIEDKSTKIELDALPDEEMLISVCSGLVVIDAESNIVRLVRM
jgi:hypothetical protein